jgi:hypothetical protein
VVCDLDLKASMVDLLDIDHDDLPLRPEVVATIESPARRAQAIQAITGVLSTTTEPAPFALGWLSVGCATS